EPARSRPARLPGIRRESRAWRWIEYSSCSSLCLAGLIAHHSNEQVGNAGRAHVAQRGELLAIDMIKQQDAAAEPLALVHGLESPRRSEPLGMHHYFEIARLHLFHTVIKHDAAAVDEHQIGEDVLDLLHLMGGHHDGAAAIEVVV